jgi:hypothetical protein
VNELQGRADRALVHPLFLEMLQGISQEYEAVRLVLRPKAEGNSR